MRVLVTGAAGSIGRVLVPGLAASGHEVAGLDLAGPAQGHGGTWHVADCSDPDAVEDVFAAAPLDGVVHLAGMPDESTLAASLASHALTTAALLEAMTRHDVRRMVYASSNHAVGNTPREDRLTTATRPRPDTFYGVSKVTAEALLSLYADRHGLDTVACRIGSFRERPESVRGLSTWLSHGDCVRMVEAALTAPSPGYAVIYGISRNTRAWWDLAPGRALGYEPQDDAEEWAGQVEARPADDAEGSRVGGPWATPQFRGSAF